MDLQSYADAINVNVVITYYNNQNRWTAKLEYAEVIEGSCLKSEYGSGDTPDEAMSDYACLIKGKKLRLFMKQDVIVPESLTG